MLLFFINFIFYILVLVFLAQTLYGPDNFSYFHFGFLVIVCHGLHGISLSYFTGRSVSVCVRLDKYLFYVVYQMWFGSLMCSV